MSGKSRRRFLIRVVVAEAALFALGVGVIEYWQRHRPTTPEITISRETTYITEPLNADGLPDYRAAINARLNRGVTPENNAVVLLIRAYGPGDLPQELRAELFRRLGMEPLPEKGDYFVDYFEFEEELKRKGVEVPKSQWAECWERPWKRSEFPQLVRWLKGNAGPTKLAIAASHRDRHFVPMLDPPADAKASPRSLSWLAAREACQNLHVRGLMRVGEGQLEEAHHDAMACYRLAHLFANSSTGTQYLVACACAAIGESVERVLIENRRLTSEQAMKWRTELSQLGPLPSPSGTFDLHERLSLLQSIIDFAYGRTGIDIFIHDITFFGEPLVDSERRELIDVWKTHGDKVRLRMVDWNAVLQFCNQTIDRGIKILQMDDYRAAVAAVDRFREEFEAFRNEDINPAELFKASTLRPSARKNATEWFKRKFCDSIPEATEALLEARGKRRMNLDLILLGFSLAAYRADHGDYPQTLDQLKPKYAATIPGDLFSGKALHYSRSKNGFLLYSVGPNGKDDGGHGFSDPARSDPAADDISIRVPPWPRPKKTDGE